MTDLTSDIVVGGSLRVPVSRSRADEFRALYAREYPNIAGYCYLLVRDEEIARDITQEAFTRLLARWVTVREPRPFLFRVATNLANDQFRSRTRDAALLAAIAGTTPGSLVDSDRTTRDAVERLPERHRDVVLLHYYGDLPVDDVARVLRKPEGTVKRLLSEARALLANALEDSRA